MEQQELIKLAQKRLESMTTNIDGCFDLLKDIYADRQFVSYLLWLTSNEDISSMH